MLKIFTTFEPWVERRLILSPCNPLLMLYMDNIGQMLCAPPSLGVCDALVMPSKSSPVLAFSTCVFNESNRIESNMNQALSYELS
jgi:hypothetical protein